MNYATIKPVDIANGEGVRVSLFVSGCRHGCKNCFNPQAWSFEYGQPFNQQIIDNLLESLKPDFISGLTLLGGEPFEPENQQALLELVKQVKQAYPNKNIWAYSGFRLEDELLSVGAYPNCEYTLELLKNIDILVDGRFVEELKNLMLNFRGSSNQRIIDVKKSLEAGEIILSPLNNTREEICESLS